MAAPRKSKLTGLSALDSSTIESLSSHDASLAAMQAFKTDLQKSYDSILDGADSYVKSFISTKIDALDVLLGGGIPGGCFSEILGLEGVGKSTLALNILSQVQQTGGIGLLIDTEYGTASKDRLLQFGVNPNQMIISTEDLAEKAFEQIEKFANFIVQRNLENQHNIVIIDSVAGLTTGAELEANIEANQVALTARMIKKGVNHVKTVARQANLAIACNNQAKIKLGCNPQYPEYTSPGGSAIKFMAISRVMMERGTMIGDPGKFVGHKIRCKIVKCKTAGSLGRTIPIRLYYDDRGLSNEMTTFDLLVETKQFRTAGAWRYLDFNGTEIKFQGEDGYLNIYNDIHQQDPTFWRSKVVDAYKSLGLADNSDPLSADFISNASESTVEVGD